MLNLLKQRRLLSLGGALQQLRLRLAGHSRTLFKEDSRSGAFGQQVHFAFIAKAVYTEYSRERVETLVYQTLSLQ